MSFQFDPQESLIVINAEVEGPHASALLRLALDTGASRTPVSQEPLMAMGYELSSQLTSVTTGSGVMQVPCIVVKRLTALGRHFDQLEVFAHTLPASLTIDGVLGLDFLRGRQLNINFQTGQIDLT